MKAPAHIYKFYTLTFFIIKNTASVKNLKNQLSYLTLRSNDVPKRSSKGKQALWHSHVRTNTSRVMAPSPVLSDFKTTSYLQTWKAKPYLLSDAYCCYLSHMYEVVLCGGKGWVEWRNIVLHTCGAATYITSAEQCHVSCLFASIMRNIYP